MEVAAQGLHLHETAESAAVPLHALVAASASEVDHAAWREEIAATAQLPFDAPAACVAA